MMAAYMKRSGHLRGVELATTHERLMSKFKYIPKYLKHEYSAFFFPLMMQSVRFTLLKDAWSINLDKCLLGILVATVREALNFH